MVVGFQFRENACGERGVMRSQREIAVNGKDVHQAIEVYKGVILAFEHFVCNEYRPGQLSRAVILVNSIITVMLLSDSKIAQP